jgi:hypothetical protein
MKKLMGVFACLLATNFGCSRAQEKTEKPDGKIGVPGRFVLTPNADSDELSIVTGVTYSAQPAFNYPEDPENKRLMDTDGPVLDSTKRTGIDGPAQTLTFDLKQSYRIDEVALHFRFPQKPTVITLSLAENAGGPWSQPITTKLEEQPDEWWRFKTGQSRLRNIGRFIKLDFTGPKTGWNINEVKIYGSSVQQAQGVKRVQNQLVIAEKKRPYATIVLAERVQPTALRAAQLFQSLTQQMTGAQLPIVSESRFDGKSTPVFIGDSALARKNGVTVEQTPFSDDRYVMRGGGKEKFLALVGNDVQFGDPKAHYGHFFRGSLFAVYDFFERQGCGWYGPDELWQVIPQTERVSTPALAVTEIPAFKWRRIWMSALPPMSPLREAWRQGGTEIASWHNFDNLVPPGKYKVEHPEWYGAEQPDITHPGVIAVAVESLNKIMESRPDEPLMTFSVAANDTGGFKEKPYKDVGNIAAQQLYFANEVAKGLRAKQPNRHFTLGMLGYWYSHRGPEPTLKAEPEVVVSIVNEGNHTKPLEWPESKEIAETTGRNNTRELNALSVWKQTGGLKGVYEWWIPGITNKVWRETPWYDGDTAVKNLRFWHRNGIKYLDYESQQEINNGFPLRWAQYYIGARAAWNPNLDPSRELLIACRKLFGAAGERMWEYYRLQEAAMRATKEHVGNWGLPLPHLLYNIEAEQQGEALLQQAMALATGERERERIRIEMKQWQRLRELNAMARAENKKVYKVVMNGVSMDWREPTINAATVLDLSDLPPDTKFEVLEHDGQNRVALPGEIYDLNSGVTFRTLAPVSKP